MRDRQTVTGDGRHLAWEACYNARDLGGMPLADGRETRWRAVIRSDTLGRLTPAGRQALFDYGVRTLIDLRSPQEIAADPYDFNGRHTALQYLNLPLDKQEPHASVLMDSAPTLAAMYIVMLDYYADAVTAVMAAIAHARPGGIVIHCSAGKDRTGIVVALLLHFNGVTPAAIARDYAATQARLWPLYEKLIAEAGGEAQVATYLKPLTPPETVLTMLEHVDQRYGGVRCLPANSWTVARRHDASGTATAS